MSKIEVNTVEPQCGTTLTLGGSGDTVTLGSGASQSGFGRSGSVDWQTTPKTTTFTPVDGEGYFINSGSALTANLPAGSAGAIVAFSDYARNFATYNFTISPDGSEKIGGQAADAILDVDGQSITLVYVDSTKGWVNVQNAEDTETGATYMSATVSGSCNTITTAPCCANVKVAKFVNPGTFTVCTASNTAANNVVSYMVIAGGGSGGNGCTGGGGGGAGGFRELVSPTSPYSGSPLNGYPNASNRITVTATGYPIAVGGGGAAVGNPNIGNSGVASTFDTVTAAGGGAGGKWDSGGQTAGGSGGGAAQASCAPGAAGNTPPTSPPQGNNGGGRGYYQQGGGGGATAVGQDGNVCGSPATRSPTEGNGGTGATSSIDGTPTQRAGGGAGGYASASPVPGAGKATATGGGSQGGGQGSDASDAADNTGGGGGGGGNPTSAASGAGGSGLVIIRYKFQ